MTAQGAEAVALVARRFTESNTGAPADVAAVIG